MWKKIGKILLYGLPGILALVMFSCYPPSPSSTDLFLSPETSVISRVSPA